MVTVRNEWPPNIKAIERTFGDLPPGVLFAWGPDTIYFPRGGPLPQWIVAHERVHHTQQGDDVEGWWERYLTDEVFRLDQEVEAHRAEWASAKVHIGDPNDRARHLFEMARRLSSPMYGGMVTFTEAKALIRS